MFLHEVKEGAVEDKKKLLKRKGDGDLRANIADKVDSIFRKVAHLLFFLVILLFDTILNIIVIVVVINIDVFFFCFIRFGHYD